MLGPYFIDGTLTREKYLDLLQNHLPEMIVNLPPHINKDKLIFHQDGHPAHTSLAVKQHLRTMFGNRLIWVDRFADPEEGPLPPWPARSPDETPLDFFLWGHIKDKICLPDILPRDAVEMRERIRQECARLNPRKILNSCTHGVEKRLKLTIEKGDGHIQQYLRHERANQ